GSGRRGRTGPRRGPACRSRSSHVRARRAPGPRPSTSPRTPRLLAPRRRLLLPRSTVPVATEPEDPPRATGTRSTWWGPRRGSGRRWCSRQPQEGGPVRVLVLRRRGRRRVERGGDRLGRLRAELGHLAQDLVGRVDRRPGRRGRLGRLGRRGVPPERGRTVALQGVGDHGVPVVPVRGAGPRLLGPVRGRADEVVDREVVGERRGRLLVL